MELHYFFPPSGSEVILKYKSVAKFTVGHTPVGSLSSVEAESVLGPYDFA